MSSLDYAALNVNYMELRVKADMLIHVGGGYGSAYENITITVKDYISKRDISNDAPPYLQLDPLTRERADGAAGRIVSDEISGVATDIINNPDSRTEELFNWYFELLDVSNSLPEGYRLQNSLIEQVNSVISDTESQAKIASDIVMEAHEKEAERRRAIANSIVAPVAPSWENTSEPAPQKNGHFSYGAEDFDVYVTNLSYPWQLETKGSSVARQRQTIYPFRASKGDIRVTLQFLGYYIDEQGNTRNDLVDFANFARRYHQSVTSMSGVVGQTVPRMTFWVDLGEHNGGRMVKSYNVALPSIPVAQSNDSVGPTMNLTLKILGDDEEMHASGSSTYQGGGSVYGSSITANFVSQKGDNAFSASTSQRSASQFVTLGSML